MWKALLLGLLLGGIALGQGCYTKEAIWPKVEYWAKGFGLDPKLLYAVIWRESKLCPHAVGTKGEIGLGQILPSTALYLGVPPAYLYDPDWNLYTTAKYLRYLYWKFRDWRKALAAYNAGPGRVQSGDIPQTTVKYTQAILEHYSLLARTPIP